MPQEIQDLIDKIQRDGIKTAQEKSEQILQKAGIDAEAIIQQAKKESDNLLKDAKQKISLMENAQKTLLLQAGRDLLLSLKNEIFCMLQKVINLEVRQEMSPEMIFGLLREISKSHDLKQTDSVTINLKKEDSEVFEKAFLAKLKEELKKGIILQPSGEVSGGFTVSFDKGKSSFDFTDKALAEYIGKFLKPKLYSLLQEAVSKK